MNSVPQSPIPDNAALTPAGLEWLIGRSEPDFSDLDPEGQPAVLTIVEVEVEAAPLFGEPLGLADWIDGEAVRYRAREAAARNVGCLEAAERANLIAAEIAILALAVRQSGKMTVVGYCSPQRLARLDALRLPDARATLSPLAVALWAEAASYLPNDNDASRFVAATIARLANDADEFEAATVEDYLDGDAALQAAVFQVFIDDEAREEAKAEAALFGVFGV